jgi:hypothetical protein
MILVAGVVLSFFNWFLLLAPIFAIRDHLGFSDATIAGWRLSRNRAGSLTALNLAHAGIRLVWLVIMTGLAFAPLGFARFVPKVLVFAAMVAVSLAYCAVADILFVARYAGYIEIAEQESHPAPELPVLPEPEPAPVYAASNAPELAQPSVAPEAPAQ